MSSSAAEAKESKASAAESQSSADDAASEADSLQVSVARIAASIDKLARSWPPGGGGSPMETRGGSGPPIGSATDSRSAARARGTALAGEPAFTVEYVRGRAYRLRNVSLRHLSDVTVSTPGFDLAHGLPTGIALAPFESSERFVIQGALQMPAPGEVRVICAELDEPVVVPLPSRG